MHNFTLKKIIFVTFMTSFMQSASADTRLQIPIILEGNSVYNNIAIEHGCMNETTQTTSIPVVGTSVVFPNGVDSSITTQAAGALVDNQATPYSGKLTDFVTNWGNNIKKVINHDLFAQEGKKLDNNGNTLGFWAGYGSFTGEGYIGLIPFRLSSISIEPKSCASSVTFVLAIADICKLTNTAAINGESANLWTPAVGSLFDGKSTDDAYDSPATLKIVRNTTGTPATLTSAAATANPLPASCGKGLDVIVKPSAAQINRDLPVVINGSQIWPKP